MEGALDSPALRHRDDGERTAAAKGPTTARGPQAAVRRVRSGDWGGQKTPRRRRHGRQEVCCSGDMGGEKSAAAAGVDRDERFVR
jgi:hypothetical protein